MSAVLDNIAAALIGGSAAITLFKRKVHIGYLAAIVAASNAGGAGSVIGDTTTTMIWIAGCRRCGRRSGDRRRGRASAVLRHRSPARQQHRLQPLVRSDVARQPPVDLGNVGIVLLIIVGAISTNVAARLPGRRRLGRDPARRPAAQARLEGAAAGRGRRLLPAEPRAVGVDDAGREAAGPRRRGRRSASASCRRSSTTSR
jgi:hypothetical protein